MAYLAVRAAGQSMREPLHGKVSGIS